MSPCTQLIHILIRYVELEKVDTGTVVVSKTQVGYCLKFGASTFI